MGLRESFISPALSKNGGELITPPCLYMPYIIANKFQKLDWRKDGFKKPWVSRMYRRPGDTNMTHDLRCDICGKWYNYPTKDIPQIILQKRWNFKLRRPLHCGNSFCKDYHERCVVHAISNLNKMMRGEPVQQKYL